MLGRGGRDVGEGQGKMGDPNGGREGWRAQRNVQRNGVRRRTQGGEVGRGGQEVIGGRGEVGVHSRMCSGMLGGGGREVGGGQREMGDPNFGREGWRAQRTVQRDSERRRIGMADVRAEERRQREDGGRCTGGGRGGEEIAGGGRREVAEVERRWQEEAGRRRWTGGGKGGEKMVGGDNRRRRTGRGDGRGEEMVGGGQRRWAKTEGRWSEVSEGGRRLVEAERRYLEDEAGAMALQKSGETDEAYQAPMLLLITEAKQRSDAVAAAAKKKGEDAEKGRLLAIEQQRQQDEAAAKAADEERLQGREKIFSGEGALLTMAADWRDEAENGKLEESGNKIALLLPYLTDLLATCFAQQEDIHNLDDAVQTHNQVFDQLTSRLQQLEQTVDAPVASSSNTSERLEALEIDFGSLKDDVQLQQNATQHLEQRIYTAATHSRSEQRETTPKFDDQEIFCDSTKTDPIPWFHKFELQLQLHYYGVVAADLHTKINWDDLKAAWHMQFQVEPPKIKAMDKLMTFKQGKLPSVDWIAEYQRLTFILDIQMDFKAIKHYISRSCSTLGNALTHVEDTPTTPTELFDKAAQIIVTNKEAKNLRRSSATGPSRDQHRPKVVVCAAATPIDQTSEAVSANEGDRLAAARKGGRPDKGRGRGKTKTNIASSPGPGLLDEFADISESPTGVVPDRPISHEIILEVGAVPLKGCIYRMSEYELTVFRAQLDDLLDKGWIHPRSSPYGAPVLFVRKKNLRLCIDYRKLNEQTVKVLRAQLDDLLDKGWIRPSSSPYGALVLFIRKKNKNLRLCIDYRKLNVQTVNNAGPLHRIDDLLERLGDAKYFSKFDLKSGYHQISI
ncbi:hypothetical protein CBR_g19538 [Chara braunii]|uniref:Reverse transcriptase domain-containing protein n=1 Tax=Chara braunii TaxID=69332 RepID=A0A388KYK3_CHABU|nr:hypothetical protein CBR_g19538 [Chara braunii]|eukprot:GBG75023.1 hypothetical protein CBR_g19538 [Chara braunii]